MPESSTHVVLTVYSYQVGFRLGDAWGVQPYGYDDSTQVDAAITLLKLARDRGATTFEVLHWGSEPRDKCRCGAPAVVGRYCQLCLDRETDDMDPEDLEAAGEQLRDLKERSWLGPNQHGGPEE